MKLFLDESVPILIKKVLLKTRTSAVDVLTQSLSGSEDEVIFNIAQKQGRIFVTVDLKFVTRIFLSKRKHHGVILLRYKGKLPRELLIVLTEFIRKYHRKTLQNTIVVIDKEKFRVRRI